MKKYLFLITIPTLFHFNFVFAEIISCTHIQYGKNEKIVFVRNDDKNSFNGYIELADKTKGDIGEQKIIEETKDYILFGTSYMYSNIGKEYYLFYFDKNNMSSQLNVVTYSNKTEDDMSTGNCKYL
jgi:hypothetical protein